MQIIRIVILEPLKRILIVRISKLEFSRGDLVVTIIGLEGRLGYKGG